MRKRATSSTPYNLWFNCPYAHYLNTRQEGLGIVNKDESWHASLGTALHDATEGLSVGRPLGDILVGLEKATSRLPGVTPDGYEKSKEAYWVAACTVLAFNKHYLQPLLDIYDVIMVEQEITMPLTPSLFWCCRPDLILRRRSDGHFMNNNIKSTGFMSDVEMNHEFSVQMLMEARGIRKYWGYDTQASVITSLSKGQRGKPTPADREAGLTSNRLESPGSYVWWKRDSYSFKWAAGSVKKPAWEIVDTPQEWFDRIPEELQLKQCEVSNPILHNTRMDAASIIDDIITIEKLADLQICPRHYDSCNSFGTYRKRCDYYMWCWGTEQERSDNYILRSPNHPFERALQIESEL